ncbi:elongation of fatty acids protein 3-like [Selaginella moellendorffii]|nr:elongation of fatty acids protein 3-like [Selaginella moellendorffii]|eukprot:XP_002970075.2 elongation of fatty acids protein 3-like [Selaginella moellendorffii]
MAMAPVDQLLATIRYYAADHPMVSHFRWDEDHTLGASWGFVISALGIYAAAILVLKFLTSLRRSPIPLGPLQILHNLALLAGSVAIFAGCLQATLVEHEQSSWLWKASGGIDWLFCFPVETRPVGRIFFWSYAFYLSKFVELLDTLIIVLRKRRLTLFHAIQHAGNPIICFLWLHTAQSLQVIFLLVNTAIQTLLYSYFLLSSLGFDPPVKEFVTLAQILQFAIGIAAAAWVALLVRQKSAKCSGMEALAANAVFYLALMLLLTNYYIKIYVRKKPQTKKSKKAQ